MKNKTMILDPSFQSALAGLPAFLLETDADLDMAYDWVCEHLQVSFGFADDEAAFNLFYDVYNETFDVWLTLSFHH